ncbi:putative zinc-binding metallopeptidase [Pseudomonas sp. MYb118]|uniref:putative zinc-binding metallopeptidase n=1 Tax=Pseudomonas sp. MYb118 TaxID=1848720 RepID=UPI0034CF03C1
MLRFFEQLSPRSRKVWSCRCGQSLFFPNSQCLACSAALGYQPRQGRLTSMQPAEQPGTWQLDAAPDTGAWRRCANLDSPAACNWLLPASDPHRLCIACRLNRTIPDLSIADNHERWRKVEAAKRRLIAQLLGLGLSVVPRSENAETGLAFDFIGVDQYGQPPTTGHAHGLITLDIEEADDAHREQVRVHMHEPYRTLLGHFRHEIGHYYWDRLIADGPWLEPFRALFGDERASYAAALERHYQQGPPLGWQQRFVSAYATMHPWEDWAETWAHYLHMMDAVDTALGFGLSARGVDLDYPPYPASVLFDPEHPGGEAFLSVINAWIELASLLNELSHSMGQPDFYPFVLPPAAITKLHFIHLVTCRSELARDGR